MRRGLWALDFNGIAYHATPMWRLLQEDSAIWLPACRDSDCRHLERDRKGAAFENAKSAPEGALFKS